MGKRHPHLFRRHQWEPPYEGRVLRWPEASVAYTCKRSMFCGVRYVRIDGKVYEDWELRRAAALAPDTEGEGT